MAPALVKALAFAACAVSVSGHQVNKVQLRHSAAHAHDHDGSFVTPLEFKYQLRICNAYPTVAAMDIYRGASERLTGTEPMKYKSCRDFKAPLKSGDKLEFRVGEQTTGTFSIADLPNSDATLLLVVHRHDSISTAVSFESHVFAALDSAQVAIIDTYKGKETSIARIMDEPAMKDGKKVAPRSEELRFDSVVAVNPGTYDVALAGADGKERTRTKLLASKHESYVVMRTGVETKSGSFPQELVVYPSPQDMALRSGAARPLVGLAAVVALVAAWLQ